MNTEKPPLHCSFSPSIPKLLWEQKCSLIISSRQVSKAILIGPVNDKNLVQLPRDFDGISSIHTNGQKLVIATKDEVITFENVKAMAKNFPNKPDTYDSLFVPRNIFNTGPVDISDIHHYDGITYGVVTSMSCVAEITSDYSLKPLWTPPFISEISMDYRCNLTGLAIKDDRPKFVSTYSNANQRFGWKNKDVNNGLIIDVESNETICSGLNEPNTPRIYDDELYVIESANSNLLFIDEKSGKKELVTRLKGYGCGLSKWGEYLFVGLSKTREDQICGIEVIHLPTGISYGTISYNKDIEQIDSIQVINNSTRPNILSTNTGTYKKIISTPEANFWIQ